MNREMIMQPSKLLDTINETQKNDLFRYYDEALDKGYDESQAARISEIRFNYKYTFQKSTNRWKMNNSYIKRKLKNMGD